MNTKHLCLAISVMSIASGCGLETRNREVPTVQLTGSIAGQALDPSQYSRLLEDRADVGFADLTVVQRSPDGVVELTLVFADGLDVLVNPEETGDEEGGAASVSVLGRARAGGGAWNEALSGRVLSIDVVETGTEDILTERWRGVHESFDIHLLVEFDPAADATTTDTSTALSEAGPAAPHPQQTTEQVDVRVRYERDRVRRRPQEREDSSWDDDEC